MKKVSIIVPCYNEQEAIPYFYDEIVKIADNMKNNAVFELIFVNDGSKDETLKVLREYSKKDERANYISFSRNFGKEAAMLAGLKEASGDYIAIMDADLQDPPSLLPQMFDLLESGEYDCIGTRRVTRKGEPKIRSFFARLFYKIMNKISDTELVDGARDFRLMTRQMVDAILEMSEYNRFSKGIFGFVGFNIKWLEYENIERVAGQTKWSFRKLFLYALDGFTAFSTMPLIISTILGFVFCFISVILLVVSLINTFIFTNIPLLYITCLIFFVSGIQLVCIGIVGQYLAKAYLEVKHRPVYIVKERNEKVKTSL